ncbi:vesicle-associated membrane protein-associated protein B [Drosophila biarmipes]|uniref:vesicle-associated membrane protein-associated protein B n=1 Tax=Drosophila biarmipes TaxID=125945 RepID=UPI0007E67B09|nr:vesicle-associated membrane protein-associated protein B [Drosophila biarmipes]
MSDIKETKLSLEPCDGILFEGPFNRSVNKKLVIGNPSKTQKMAFKMKTTTPKLFFVRPNIGVLEPGEKVNVDIYMQPILQEPVQKRHKFLLQAVEVTGEMTDMQEFWKQQKEQKPENIWDTKIRCELVFSKDEQFRQAGGSARSPVDNKDGEDHFDAQEISEPVAKLLKQVSKLEDERLALKEEVDTLRDQTIGPDSGQKMMQRSRQGRSTLFYVVAFFLTILAAFVGAFYGKNYL